MANDYDEKYYQSGDHFYDVNKIGQMVVQDGVLHEQSTEVLKSAEFGSGLTRTADGATGPSHKLFYSDGSDSLANRGFVVSFQHVASYQYVHFKAFITAFNESYNSDWNSESVYGRTDPIKMFKQTTRGITLGLIIPAASEGEGFENLGKVQEFLSFLYPSYTDVDNALTISQSPLVRLRVMNLIRKTRYGQDHSERDQALPPPNSYKDHKRAQSTLNSTAAQQGLLGNITNVSINHNIENGEAGSFILADGVIIPKAIELTVDFQVIHEKALGWKDSQFSDMQFPYGVDLSKTKSRSRGEIFDRQEQLAKEAVKSVLKQRAEDEEEQKSEQMRQNAIAAGYLVADGVTSDGKVRYALTSRGKKAKGYTTEGDKRINADKTWYNPFDARPYPEGSTASAEAAELATFLNNPSNFIS